MRTATLLILFVCIASHLKSQEIADHRDMFVNQGCSSFCLDNNGYAIFGANYDLTKNKYDGLVIVNKRTVSKTFHQPDSSGNHVRWTSKYGSVSFNFIASQTSWTGMNEAGLVIHSMRLDEGSRAPKPDTRSSISAHYWLQYMLDNFSTVKEVVASDSTLRVFSPDRIPHYLVSDRYGHCATIEFIDAKTVIHSGNDLPVKVLANTAYASSIAEWNNITLLKKNRKPIPPTGTTSRSRFLRAVERVTAFKPTDSKSAVNIAFDILEDISRANTYWSIVYDTKNLQVHFKTIVHSDVRMIDFHKLDFSCQSPVKMIDVNDKLSGDITEQLVEYSYNYHFEHALTAVRKYELKMTSEELKKYILDVEAFPCLDAPMKN